MFFIAWGWKYILGTQAMNKTRVWMLTLSVALASPKSIWMVGCVIFWRRDGACQLWCSLLLKHSMLNDHIFPIIEWRLTFSHFKSKPMSDQASKWESEQVTHTLICTVKIKACSNWSLSCFDFLFALEKKIHGKFKRTNHVSTLISFENTFQGSHKTFKETFLQKEVLDNGMPVLYRLPISNKK